MLVAIVQSREERTKRKKREREKEIQSLILAALYLLLKSFLLIGAFFDLIFLSFWWTFIFCSRVTLENNWGRYVWFPFLAIIDDPTYESLQMRRLNQFSFFVCLFKVCWQDDHSWRISLNELNRRRLSKLHAWIYCRSASVSTEWRKKKQRRNNIFYSNWIYWRKTILVNVILQLTAETIGSRSSWLRSPIWSLGKSLSISLVDLCLLFDKAEEIRCFLFFFFRDC